MKTVSQTASGIYQAAKKAAIGAWNWKAEWKKAMKAAWAQVINKVKEAVVMMVASNLPGYCEINQICDAYDAQEDETGRRINKGTSVLKAAKIRMSDIDAVLAKYPMAALYIKAEGYLSASNDRKLTAGHRTCKMILAGANIDDAKASLKDW